MRRLVLSSIVLAACIVPLAPLASAEWDACAPVGDATVCEDVEIGLAQYAALGVFGACVPSAPCFDGWVAVFTFLPYVAAGCVYHEAVPFQCALAGTSGVLLYDDEGAHGVPIAWPNQCFPLAGALSVCSRGYGTGNAYVDADSRDAPLCVEAAPCAWASADAALWLGAGPDGSMTYGGSIFDLAWCVPLGVHEMECVDLL